MRRCFLGGGGGRGRLGRGGLRHDRGGCQQKGGGAGADCEAERAERLHRGFSFSLCLRGLDLRCLLPCSAAGLLFRSFQALTLLSRLPQQPCQPDSPPAVHARSGLPDRLRAPDAPLCRRSDGDIPPPPNPLKDVARPCRRFHGGRRGVIIRLMQGQVLRAWRDPPARRRAAHACRTQGGCQGAPRPSRVHAACVDPGARRGQSAPFRCGSADSSAADPESITLVTTRSSTMKPTDLFNDLQQKVSEALRNSPAKDIEKRAQHDDAGLCAPGPRSRARNSTCSRRCWPARAPGSRSWKPAWPSSSAAPRRGQRPRAARRRQGV